jgi:hypothetical protein
MQIMQTCPGVTPRQIDTWTMTEICLALEAGAEQKEQVETAAQLTGNADAWRRMSPREKLRAFGGRAR